MAIDNGDLKKLKPSKSFIDLGFSKSQVSVVLKVLHVFPFFSMSNLKFQLEEYYNLS